MVLASSVTTQPEAVASIKRTRAPRRGGVPRSVSHAIAASGSRALRSTRGSSRLEPPLAENSASRSTRKKTWPLARSAGVFSAETHSGSISEAMTPVVRPWQSSLTDSPGAH